MAIVHWQSYGVVHVGKYGDSSTLYSSDRRRAAGLVTLTPNTFALKTKKKKVRALYVNGVMVVHTCQGL
jgi:hypothetical protein